MQFVDFILLGILGAILYALFAFRPEHRKADKAAPQPANKPDASNKKAEETPASPINLTRLADDIESVMDKMAHPSEALDNKDFMRGVNALVSDDFTVEQAGNYALGSNWILSCIGYEALSRRTDSASYVDKAIKAIRTEYAWPLYFLIRFVDARREQPVAARVLCGARTWWPNNQAIIDHLAAFLNKVSEEGETITFGQEYAELSDEKKEYVRKFAKVLPDGLQESLLNSLKQHDDKAIDFNFLKTVGVILDHKALADPVFETDQSRRIKQDIIDDFAAQPGKSLLLVGTSGVGKSAFVRALAKDLVDDGWTVVKTSASNIIADQSYIGQIEGRVRRLAKNATVAKKVAVYVENMAEFRQLGRYKNNNNSVLDHLWPDIEARDFFLIGETTPTGLQALAKDHPTLATVMRVVSMNAAPESETAHMANSLLTHLAPDLDEQGCAEVVNESLQLAQQYLTHKSLPGSVLSLLELTVSRAQRDGADSITREHVMGALSQISGLPKEVLDEKQVLDIEAVSQSFKSRIIGQDEAVDCLVERIAMLKAGLTDPGRPVGVFLFAGPTGTGKTEIAKTLSSMLFGSAEQMIRLDMSEYQSADSSWRLIGGGDSGNAEGSLVNRIRQNPFSVVLLDEFEKAHTKVWDMFLQVFDDGRLSDVNGQLADFRHAIIILTSNLGATISNEAGVGFTSTSGGFSAKDVTRAVNQTFRREFINRLDRVVVFRPLSIDVMRAILQNELNKVLDRRGLRTREWAVEWEDSAIEFLLAEGFTPDLGARPLRRAIERHLLAPLSITMVQNQAPEGEQFLFVRSNGEQLQVEFIDPDAEPEVTVSGSPSLQNADSAALAEQLQKVVARMASPEWLEAKSDDIAKVNRENFWHDPERFRILDRIELIDRLESAAGTLQRLMGRLQQHPQNTRLVRSIANRLYVLDEGIADLDSNRATEAYLGVRLVSEDTELEGAGEFLDKIVEMYRSWARARGMRQLELSSAAGRYDAVMKISGFGSYGILAPESGLHVFEIPDGDTRFKRIRVRVEVAGVPATIGQQGGDESAAAASLLDRSADKVDVVRRYRREPSPLARDSVRHWRSGKLDRVFAGDFDILGSLEQK